MIIIVAADLRVRVVESKKKKNHFHIPLQENPRQTPMTRCCTQYFCKVHEHNLYWRTAVCIKENRDAPIQAFSVMDVYPH